MAPWPNGARVAILLAIQFEVWSEGHGPTYSVQTTHLKPGTVDHSAITWGKYGGNAGVARLLRVFERHGVPATFCTSAQCCTDFPEAVRAIVAAGHDIAGHGYTQDQLQSDLSPAEERAYINRCLDTLEAFTGTRPVGWLSPVHAWTPATTGILVDAGMLYQGDANYTDRPCVVTVNGKPIVHMQPSDFADNRVLRSSPRAYFDVYKDTFEYLYRHEPGSHLTLTIHAHHGGRPPIMAIVDELLSYWKTLPDVWFARHREVAQVTLDAARDLAATP